MPKICYTPRKFIARSRALIDHANVIIADYESQGLILSGRQLYYQLVTKNLIPNSERSAKNLGDLIRNARYAGEIDWLSLEDRSRNLRRRPHWTDPGDVIRSAAYGYRVDLWADQPLYCEVWIEKDAAVGVVEPVCEEYDVPLFSCRGYNSSSEQWSGAQRIVKAISRRSFGSVRPWRKALILYLGDHDPSGLDMRRDLEARLKLFTDDADIEFRPLALLREQVDELDLPPNPAKEKDSRYAAYEAVHGSESWELDALTPSFIVDLLRRELGAIVDKKKFAAAKRRQETDRKLLISAADRWDELVRYLKKSS